MSVFRLDQNFKIILNPDAVKLIPELRTLSQDELLFVILATDYIESPYRLKPIEERKMMSWRRVYGETPMKITKAIESAMELYKSLIFDVKRETMDILKQKLDREYKNILKSDMTTLSLKETTNNISFLEDRIDKLSKEVFQQEKIYELKGQKKLSMIEHWQMNQKEFRKFNEN